jgi:hypothetical protein
LQRAAAKSGKAVNQENRGMVEAKTRNATGRATAAKRISTARPTQPQREWLRRGLDQPGGKLPLFDVNGRRVSERTILSCIEQGWAEPWFENPVKPDWLVCKLTESGREAVDQTNLRGHQAN